MKLWILRPVHDLTEDNNPWEPWYDKAFGFVVSAEYEDQARLLAHGQAGDENRMQAVWLDEAYSTCIPLEPGAVASVVLRDFAAA